MTSFIFGRSSQGIPISGFRFSNNGPEVLILGGVHGDEYEGVVAAQGLLAEFQKQFSYKLNVTLVPIFNIEGVLAHRRTNGNGVDLNRNLPTQDWSSNSKGPRYFPGQFANSEPENQALVHFIEKTKPQFILSLHSWYPVLNVNGDCLPEANVLNQWTGYKVDTDIGYPTPGCLGTFAGLERQSPVLTYEIERGSKARDILKMHVPAILEALKVTETRYARRSN